MMRIEFNNEILAVQSVRWYYDSKSIFFESFSGQVYEYVCTCISERNGLIQKLRDTGYIRISGEVKIKV